MGESNNINISDENETSALIRLHAENIVDFSYKFRSDGFDVLYTSEIENYLEMIVTPGELNKLKDKGYNFEILSRGRPFIEIQNERQKGFLNPLISPPPGYLDLSGVLDEMDDFESLYPSICKVVDLTETYNLESTYEGRHLFALKISDNVNYVEDEPSFLMVSCHHARELVTPVIALYAIEQLTSEYGNDPDITAAVNNYEIWIVPVWNPDGYEHVFYVDNMWRKNKFPPDGVDLNRNYPFGWNSGCSGSTDPYSETYKGTSPASELETQTMIAFSNDRHFAKVVDYHSYGREVLYGYCCHSHPFDSFFNSEAISLSSASGYGGSVRGPSAEGENYEWQIYTNGTYANLIETHSDFQPSYSSALTEASTVWPGALWMLQRPISVSGHITDSITGEILVTSIIIDGVSFSNGEEFYNEPMYGRYHLFLPPGTYTLEFSYENHHTQTHEVIVTSTSSEILDVELVRLNEKPNKPSMAGPDIGKVGNEYEFTFSATDPNEDELEYYIEWGDGHMELWDGPFVSGEEVTFNHTWDRKGTFTINVKVRDIFGEESDIEDYQIIIEEKSKSFSREFLVLKFLFQKFYYIYQALIEF
jgi:hypothetical protein